MFGKEDNKIIFLSQFKLLDDIRFKYNVLNNKKKIYFLFAGNLF